MPGSGRLRPAQLALEHHGSAIIEGSHHRRGLASTRNAGHEHHHVAARLRSMVSEATELLCGQNGGSIVCGCVSRIAAFCRLRIAGHQFLENVSGYEATAKAGGACCVTGQHLVGMGCDKFDGGFLGLDLQRVGEVARDDGFHFQGSSLTAGPPVAAVRASGTQPFAYRHNRGSSQRTNVRSQIVVVVDLLAKQQVPDRCMHKLHSFVLFGQITLLW